MEKKKKKEAVLFAVVHSQPHYLPYLGRLFNLSHLSFFICNVKIRLEMTSQHYLRSK